MRWASAVSDATDLEAAIAATSAAVRAELGPEPADLALLFVSHHYAPHDDAAAALLQKHLPHRVLLGCSAGGVIGGGHEIEHRAGVALTVARLPGVEIVPFAIEPEALPNADASPGAWHTALGVGADPTPHFVVLADPFSASIEHLLAGLDYAYPRSTKVGGMASGARMPGANWLHCGDTLHRRGAVGVALSGNVYVETVVAQGCRPIGKRMQITRCRDNVLFELDGDSPLQVLQELIPTLTEDDRQLLSRALSLGVAVDELALEQQHGDFLIRNIIGVDPEAGALVIGERLRDGQTVQFHVRDAGTSAADLDELLGRLAAATRPAPACGALLFSCLGRGEHLYGRADHDTDLFRERVGDLPLGGFFCNGEIGPVAGATRIHGFTSSFGIFSPARP